MTSEAPAVNPKPEPLLSSQVLPTQETASKVSIPRGLWDASEKAHIATDDATPFPLQVAPNEGVRDINKLILQDTQGQPKVLVVRNQEALHPTYTILGVNKPFVYGQSPLSSNDPRVAGKLPSDVSVYEWGTVSSPAVLLNHATAVGSKEFQLHMAGGVQEYKAERAGRVMGEHAFANTPWFRYKVMVATATTDEKNTSDTGFLGGLFGKAGTDPETAAVLQQSKDSWSVTTEPGADQALMVVLCLILDTILGDPHEKMFE